MSAKVTFVKSKFTTVNEKDVLDKEQAADLWSGRVTPENDKAIYKKEYTYSDCKVDGDKMAEDINLEIQKLTSEGFIIQSLTPVSSGAYQEITNMTGTEGYGYGFSYTEGILILAHKI